MYNFYSKIMHNCNWKQHQQHFIGILCYCIFYINLLWSWCLQCKASNARVMSEFMVLWLYHTRRWFTAIFILVKSVHTHAVIHLTPVIYSCSLTEIIYAKIYVKESRVNYCSIDSVSRPERLVEKLLSFKFYFGCEKRKNRTRLL